jgi:hypothetical protein
MSGRIRFEGERLNGDWGSYLRSETIRLRNKKANSLFLLLYLRSTAPGAAVSAAL